jgi:hypothetical protein
LKIPMSIMLCKSRIRIFEKPIGSSKSVRPNHIRGTLNVHVSGCPSNAIRAAEVDIRCRTSHIHSKDFNRGRRIRLRERVASTQVSVVLVRGERG